MKLCLYRDNFSNSKVQDILVPCPSLSEEPPATKIAIKAAPRIPKTGAVKLIASIPIDKYELKTRKDIACRP